jgi:drug/metabolite transporter (DMT)-like permease
LSEQEIATSEMGSQGSSCDAGGALAFILWVLALQRATPTRVANTMTVNPIAAALLATLLVGEPIILNLLVGLVAVFLGIWIATTEPAKPS